MKIAYVGKFQKLWDEEYIAQSLEELGHEVVRIEDSLGNPLIEVLAAEADFVLCAKLHIRGADNFVSTLKQYGIPLVSWTFDLWWDYEPRKQKISSEAFFKADLVLTTDGGHDEEFKRAGINHKLLRQGIYWKEAGYSKHKGRAEDIDVLFVGSHNPSHPNRKAMIDRLMGKYGRRFLWVGHTNSDAARSTALNDLFCRAKVVMGDSVYSPLYWSNRIYETTGRGGFIIHPYTEGINEEFPLVPTFPHGDFDTMVEKIDFYLKNDSMRGDITYENLQLCKREYNSIKRCEALINHAKEICK